MQGAVAVPIPNRPLGRTRRRSSSLSVISSPLSPAASLWTDHRSPSKPGSKRVKRTRCTTGGESPLASHSPLKQSLPLHEAPEEDSYPTTFWSAPNPFALRAQASQSSSHHHPAGPASTASVAQAVGIPFCTSASDFALAGSNRSRHASTDAALSSSTASLASSKGSFDDSSFASVSPAGSLPSTSSSPPSPYTSSILASSSRGRASVVPIRPPSLRRSSSCGSPMLTESNTLPPMWDPLGQTSDELPVEDLEQAESLHRAAFEQLRHATRADEEGFVERMRRWEMERSARDALFGLGGDPDTCKEEEDDDDEVDILLDPLDDGDVLAPVSPRPRLQRVSHAELDELAQRLRTGACEVEDYALVRDVQARYRTRTRSVA
ncbi:hypothetical protein JCM3774_004739 [Rhodotorula dairenensis]